MQVIGCPNQADMEFLSDKKKCQYLSNLISSLETYYNIIDTKFKKTSESMRHLLKQML